VGYVLGTFPSADVVTWVVTRGRVDLRVAGSGNPGGFNAMRVIGRRSGLVVIILDIAKGVTAGFVGMAIGGDGGAYAAGTAAVAGHIWPVWFRFRGGKGVATSGGVLIAVFPSVFPAVVAVTLATTVATHRSELAMWVACTAWVAGSIVWWAADLSNVWGPEPAAGLVVFSLLCSVFVLGKFRLAARTVPVAG
jgi:acyl phosphate:glycerol-3-phosphate acyltransferase